MKTYLTAITNPGIVRDNNEDAVAICPDLYARTWSEINNYIPLGLSGALAIVADGMGGANAGEVASSLAIERIKHCFLGKTLPSEASDDEKCNFLKSAIAEAGADILTRVENDPETIGMGTTIVVLWLEGNKAHIAWCGDSRCYVFKTDKGLLPLTKDHSYVQEMVDKGEISYEEMISHPDSNLITRGLGDIDTDSTADTKTIPVVEGDIFLLCSDGLCGYCQDVVIEDIMYRHLNDIPACRQALLDAALQTGGQDNISIALVATLPSTAKKRRISLITRLKRMFR